jgi:hypothetical protein
VVRPVLVAIAAVIAQVGCASHYSSGPAFREVAPRDGLAIVYAYRPASSWGAANPISADVYGRSVLLWSNSYAAFAVPAGPLTANLRIDGNVNQTMVNGVGVTGVVISAEAVKNGTRPVPIQVEAGKSYFVRVSFDERGKPPAAKLVSAEKGRSEIASVHLIPGGRARWPVVMPPAAAAAP